MKRIQKRITTIMFFVTLMMLPLITLFSEKKDFSELENRPLQKSPAFSFDDWFDKSFMSEFESFVSDHFTGRAKWINVKINSELMTGKNEINGIYITDERLIEKIPEPEYEAVDRSIEAINKLAETTETPVYVMIAPTSAGVYTDTLPKNAPQLDQQEVIEHIYGGFNSKVSSIDVFDILNASKEDYIYYRTDHHWTSLGAYVAYSTAISKLGFTSIPYSKYDVEHASSDFLGTYYSKTLYDSVQSDTIDIYSNKDGGSVVSCTINNGLEEKTYDSIYFREFLETKDKYSTYLGTNQPVINIKTNLQSDKKILVFKDSYANSFIPFLTQHYNEITALDMRYINNFREYALPEDYTHILFLYNCTTFASDDNIKKIAY
jgi:hypothetical protein